MATFAVIAVAGFSLLPADAASAGTIEGGKYTVDVAGTKDITLEKENVSSITISPNVNPFTYEVKDGNIRIPNIPAGTYTITLTFKFDQSMCENTWITRITTALTPPLAAMCKYTGVGKSYYGFQKVFTNVVVTDTGVTKLNPPSGELGKALKTDANGNPAIDCAGKGMLMSFVVCPVLESILGVSDWIIENFIQPYLSINPLTTTTEDGEPSQIYVIWNNIRNLANIVFIIAFFAIIFSQATSIGITNYGIKRLLPRLILIGVATNVSFFICAVLVDFFNVLGAGIASLMVVGVNGGSLTLDPSVSNGFVIGLAAVLVLAPGLIVAAAAPIVFGIFVFMLFVAFILFLAALAIIIRQIIIIVYVLLSPIAFIAGLMPNTQRFFSQWFKSFIQLLAVYPLFMVCMAAGKIISDVLFRISG